jgi:hypothetical protein
VLGLLYSALSVLEVVVGSSHYLQHWKIHYLFSWVPVVEAQSILLMLLIAQYRCAGDLALEAALAFEGLI